MRGNLREKEDEGREGGEKGEGGSFGMMREGFGRGRDGWQECLEVEMIGWELEILISDFRVFGRDLNM